MHKLTREVRFSIDPFLAKSDPGFNSYASKPCGEGLSLYFGLWVELSGVVDEDTGFVINVTDIDRVVREFVVPVFAEKIKGDFSKGEHIGLGQVFELLKQARSILKDKFQPAGLNRLWLQLNPFRKITIGTEETEMFYFSEKFEFAATHRLWNDKFSEQQNFETFGKCANPAGHGHNYIVEVTVKRTAEGATGWTGGFEKVVEAEFISAVDHKNLNADVAEFEKKNPTVENIAEFGWEKLAGKFEAAELSSITVWETDRTYCTYCG